MNYLIKYHYQIFFLESIVLAAYAYIEFNQVRPDLDIVSNALIWPTPVYILSIISAIVRLLFGADRSEPTIFMNMLLGGLFLILSIIMFWGDPCCSKRELLYYFVWLFSIPTVSIISTLTAIITLFKNRDINIVAEKPSSE